MTYIEKEKQRDIWVQREVCRQRKQAYFSFTFYFLVHLVCVQFSSVTQSCPTLCDPMDFQASLSITNSRSLLQLNSCALSQ